MAPSPKTIEQIFCKIGDHPKEFLSHASQDVTLQVMGHEHASRNSHSSHQSVLDEFFGQFQEFVDWKTVEMTVRHVIAQEDWASVELHSKATSKKGKPINHEFVFITHFNKDDQIDQIRAYVDSKHLDDHFEHHKN